MKKASKNSFPRKNIGKVMYDITVNNSQQAYSMNEKESNPMNEVQQRTTKRIRKRPKRLTYT